MVGGVPRSDFDLACRTRRRCQSRCAHRHPQTCRKPFPAWRGRVGGIPVNQWQRILSARIIQPERHFKPNKTLCSGWDAIRSYPLSAYGKPVSTPPGKSTCGGKSAGKSKPPARKSRPPKISAATRSSRVLAELARDYIELRGTQTQITIAKANLASSNDILSADEDPRRKRVDERP